MPRIAKVIVEIGLNREFDYIIPERLDGEIQVGSRVVVPFGKGETRGCVVALADSSRHANLKEIRDRIGRKVMVEEGILGLARWMADYYLSPIELAVRTVLPSAVRRKGAGFKEQMLVAPTELATDALAVETLRKRSPKQAAVLDLLLAGNEIHLSALAKAANVGPGVVRALEKKGFARIGRGSIRRDPMGNQIILPTKPLDLMPQQAQALDVIKKSIDCLTPPVVLLHGVTGSGKTEVYLQAIAHAMERGKGAVVLVPEISLTPQTTERFRARFGDVVAILHSRLGDGERHDEWHRVHEGKARIVVGARSALFSPVANLGLIVVDEEHEPSYKQDETPRYNARDVAVVRGRMEKCAVVLGTATPALESFHNTSVGKYELVSLPHRVDHRRMPVMRIVDMRIEAEREGRPNVFSRDLAEAIRLRLERSEQTMLFLNRRGFATSLVCPKCGYVAQCEQCSVSMTYHRQTEELVCHICGERKHVPTRCPNDDCRDPAFRFAGFGTQRVESVMASLFPKARVQRMDSDTTTGKDSHSAILGEFRTGRIDILVGTQMIAKGLHFPNVTLVGVLCADMSLHMPDFRAAERTFQLLTQVAGRAGRGDVAGEVIVQTYTPFHPAIQAARRLDYQGFYDQEIEMRKELLYPPFSHLICITVRGPDEAILAAAAQEFADKLTPMLPRQVRLGGPAPAPLARAKGLYRIQLMLRAPSTRMMTEPLRKVMADFRWHKDIRCAVDVDALSLM